MKRIVALVALLIVVVPLAISAQCTDADAKALQALDKAWTTAADKGDRAFVEGVYAVNFVGHASAGPVDKAAVLRDVDSNKANPSPSAMDDRYLISCTSKTATISHRSIEPPSSPDGRPTYRRVVHFLEKSGDKWQLVSSMGHMLTDAQILTYMELDWNDATKAHDGQWVEKNFAPFSLEISSRTGSIEDKAQSVQSAKTDKRVFQSLEMSDFSVRVEGDAAVATGVNHAVGKDAEGKPIDRRIRFTDTFIKREGRWQVWASQGTLIQ